MWTLFNIFSGIFSSALTKITSEINDAYKAKLNAANNDERVAADERIALLEARKTSILAAQSDPAERWVRIGFALPFVIYINKLVVWDKVLGWGVTDPLSENLTDISLIILGGYFVDTIVKRFKR